MLIAVGPLCRETAEAARRSGVDEVYHHPDSARASEGVVELMREGDLIVVKGSRGMRMERVVQSLLGALGQVD